MYGNTAQQKEGGGGGTSILKVSRVHVLKHVGMKWPLYTEDSHINRICFVLIAKEHIRGIARCNNAACSITIMIIMILNKECC